VLNQDKFNILIYRLTPLVSNHLSIEYYDAHDIRHLFRLQSRRPSHPSLLSQNGLTFTRRKDCSKWELCIGAVGVSFKIEKRRERCLVTSIKGQESLDFVFAGPTPRGEVLFQAVINFRQSSLNGTFRLIVSPGSPMRFNSPTGSLFCAYPAILLTLWGR
jgi:hypothetical protein